MTTIRTMLGPMLMVAMPPTVLPAVMAVAADAGIPVWVWVVLGIASEVILILLGIVGWVWRRGRDKEDEHVTAQLATMNTGLAEIKAQLTALHALTLNHSERLSRIEGKSEGEG